MQPLQAIDRVLLRVRPQLAGSDTHAQLGPVRTAGDAAQPVQFFLVTAAGKAVFHALAGRRASDGGVRLVSLTYEDAAPGASEACVEKSALELLRRLVVLAAPVGPGAGDPVAPTLRFSQAAAAEIKRQLQPGDSVWIQAARSPSGMDYQLELRPPGDVAQDADRLAVDGISVAIDRASVVAVDGVTIDFLASAKGFVFHKQDSKP